MLNSGESAVLLRLTLIGLFFFGNILLGQAVKLDYREADSRVDVRVGGEIFTSYLFGEMRRKPILFPVSSAGGNVVNRRFPLEPAGPDESEDHLHQESLYIAYGDVNGTDFWRHRGDGKIVHREIKSLENGSPAELGVVLDWIDGAGMAILREFRRFSFGATPKLRWIDVHSRLVARSRVHFGETKEGFFAIRVDPRLREDRGEASYLSASGREGADKIWGQRSPWVALKGSLEKEMITLAIFDHPITFNHPSYWHVRAYGLFSANPLGRKDFVDNANPKGITRMPGEFIEFRYRFLIYSGGIDKTQIDEDYQNYIR